MGRYANANVRLEFPDLSEDGDDIFVVIRNPKTVPIDKLAAGSELAVDVEGNPSRDDAMAAGYEVIAGLIVDWHVYDANLDDGPALGLPATVDMVKTLPLEISSRISDEIAKVTTPPT